MHLAEHRVVDLRPDRSAATVAAWWAEPPTISVVGRDRRDRYADGMRRGAPEAVPVVDRFPLVHNLRQVLDACLLDHRPALQAAAIGTAMALSPADGMAPVIPMDRGRRQSPNPAPQPAERPPRHARWVTIDEAVRTLRARGTPIAIMARQLGIHRPPFKMTAAKVRLAMAAMGQLETKIGDLCREWGVTRQTLHRHVGPDGALRHDGRKLLQGKRS